MKMDRRHGQEESAVSDDVVVGESGEQESGRPAAFRPVETGPAKGGHGLRMYKPRQGYYTRLGTAIGIGVLTICGAYFLMDQLGMLDLGASSRLAIQYGVPAGFILVMGAVVYWLVGISRRPNDFFIATEGEMKKVRWSTRKELTRSTKVVIVTVVLLGTFLFLWDVAFMMFFSTIKILKGSPGLERLFGTGS
jgi:preprotein translocase subunit SecE